MTPTLKNFLHSNPWLVMVAFIASFGLLLALQIKRNETPINFILLTAFVSFKIGSNLETGLKNLTMYVLDRR